MSTAPTKLYKLLYADPAWTYDNKGMNGTLVDRKGMAIYNSSSVDEMAEIPLPADENCVLLMWAVFPMFDKCVSLMQRWGFVMKGIELVWLKTYSESGKFVWNPSSYAASNVEAILLGTRGDRWRSMFALNGEMISNRREPGRKPEESYDYVLDFAKRFDLGEPLEMFVRGRHPGFGAWVGDQMDDYAHVTPESKMEIVKVKARKAGKDAFSLVDLPHYRFPSNSPCSIRLPRPAHTFLLELHSASDVYLVDWGAAFAGKSDPVVVFRAPHESAHLHIEAATQCGFQFKTLMFYVRTGRNLGIGKQLADDDVKGVAREDPDRVEETTLYFVALGTKRSRIGNRRQHFVSQLVHRKDGESATRAVVERLRVAFGTEEEVCLLRTSVARDWEVVYI